MFVGMKKIASRAALVLAATVALGACDSTTEPDDHQEAAGVVITDESNNTLVSINAARQVTGTLTVQAGQARHLDFYFVDEDGDRFQLEAGDDEHSLEWTVANEAVAVIDSHGDHMDLDGISAGSTTVEFRLMHGNHSDYTAPLIPIVVTP
jgi:hypothetical protein